MDLETLVSALFILFVGEVTSRRALGMETQRDQEGHALRRVFSDVSRGFESKSCEQQTTANPRCAQHRDEEAELWLLMGRRDQAETSREPGREVDQATLLPSSWTISPARECTCSLRISKK